MSEIEHDPSFWAGVDFAIALIEDAADRSPIRRQVGAHTAVILRDIAGAIREIFVLPRGSAAKGYRLGSQQG